MPEICMRTCGHANFHAYVRESTHAYAMTAQCVCAKQVVVDV